MVRRQDTGPGETEEQISAVDHIIQRAVLAVLGKRGLGRIHIHLAPFVDQPVDIAEPDILAFDPQLEQHVEARNTCRPATRGHDLDIFEGLAGHVQRVLGCGPHDNSGAVLVIVENGDVHALAANAFDGEAVGRLDVFEVNCTKSRFKSTDDVSELFRIGLVDLDVETVDRGEFLEQDRFAFHHRF